MDDGTIKLLRYEASYAKKMKDYRLAFKKYKQLAECNIPDGLFMCGFIQENKFDHELHDLDAAYKYYTKLAINWGEDAGYLGCVRVILAQKDEHHRDKALAYCRDLVKGEEKRYGYLTMGRVYEELFQPPKDKLARVAYFYAFVHGATLGLRKYATSLMRSRKCIRGVVMHVIATLVAPVLFLFGGAAATRDG